MSQFYVVCRLAAAALLGMLTVAGVGAQQAVPDQVMQTLSKMIPGAVPDSVVASPVDGWYEVTFGPHVVYVTGDGAHLFRGDLIEVGTRTNLTEEKRTSARRDAIEDLGEESMIVFSPDKPSYTITVFTDTTCGYCAKLHNEMAEINKLGISVRYLAFPRAGVSSASYDTMVSVWCADDPLNAMTMAKARQPVEPRTCDNPVREHFAMGQLIGVTGTPTIILENGDVVPGYLPPRRLLERIRSG